MGFLPQAMLNYLGRMGWSMPDEREKFTLDEMIEESRRPTIYITSAWYTRFTNQLEGTFSTIPRM